jgi:SLT domain-containing protein
MFGGGRAQGGNVQGGRSYLVGEYGPEVVTMGGNGTVTPNMGGNVSVNVNVDSTGGSVESNESFGKQLGNAIKATVQSELLKQKRQGGLLA